MAGISWGCTSMETCLVLGLQELSPKKGRLVSSTLDDFISWRCGGVTTTNRSAPGTCEDGREGGGGEGRGGNDDVERENELRAGFCKHAVSCWILEITDLRSCSTSIRV